MKYIKDTLGVIKNAVTAFKKESQKDAFIALIGGYAVIYYGVERTTLDIDACFYSTEKEAGKTFSAFLQKHLPKRFETRFIETTKDSSDPLEHDIIIINDVKNEYPRIDILIANYKWELEGLKKAKISKTLAFHVIPVAYLINMKLKAGGRKDDLDVIELLKNLSPKEINACKELAKKVGRNRKLAALLKETDK